MIDWIVDVTSSVSDLAPGDSLSSMIVVAKSNFRQRRARPRNVTCLCAMQTGVRR